MGTSLHSPTSLETKHLQEQARAEQAEGSQSPLLTGPAICIPAESRPSSEAESGMGPAQGGTDCSELAASSTGSPGWKQSQPSVQPGPVLWTSLTWLDSPVRQLARPGLECSGPFHSSLPPLLCLWMTSGHSLICVPGMGSRDSMVSGGAWELVSKKQ